LHYATPGLHNASGYYRLQSVVSAGNRPVGATSKLKYHGLKRLCENSTSHSPQAEACGDEKMSFHTVSKVGGVSIK
jgi:hypothetical protein